MKKTERRLVMLVTVLFLLIMGTGATIVWGSVTVPVKGKQYQYNFETKKWEKTNVSFTATYSRDGKLKNKAFKYGPDTSKTTYTWKGDYLKKIKYTYSDGSSTTRTYTYKKGKPSKETFSGSTTTYSWKGKKGTATEKFEDYSSTYYLTLKSGRLYKEKHSSYELTYTYYKKGHKKTYASAREDFNYKVTYGKNGLPKKVYEDSTYTSTYTWKKKEVLITNRENGKVVSKEKWKFSKMKKVGRAWNCDAYGLPVTLFEVNDVSS